MRERLRIEREKDADPRPKVARTPVVNEIHGEYLISYIVD
jgi:hypothetical protein